MYKIIDEIVCITIIIIIIISILSLRNPLWILHLQHVSIRIVTFQGLKSAAQLVVLNWAAQL